MNMTCDVVRDLAELYQEELVSEESRREIRAHLAECNRCRHYYKAYEALNKLDEPLHRAEQIEDAEARSYEVISRRLRRRRMIQIAGTGAAVGAGSIMLVVGLILLSKSTASGH